MHYAFFALIMPGEAQRGRLGNFRITKLIKNHVTVFSQYREEDVVIIYIYSKRNKTVFSSCTDLEAFEAMRNF